MLVSHVSFNSTILVMLLNQILRTVYFDKLNFSILMITSITIVSVLTLLLICWTLKKQQVNASITLVIIAIYFIINQLECFRYQIDNTSHCLLSILLFSTLFHNTQEKTKIKLFFTYIETILMFIFASIKINDQLFTSVDELINLINSKINILLFIICCYKIIQHQSEYRSLDPQSQRKSKQITLDQVLVSHTPVNNSLPDITNGIELFINQNQLLNNLNEAVILGTYKLNTHDNECKLEFKSQNAASDFMFGKEIDQIGVFFDNLECELAMDNSASQFNPFGSSPPQLERPSHQRKLFVSQQNFGFSVQDKKSYSPNSKIIYASNKKESPDSIVSVILYSTLAQKQFCKRQSNQRIDETLKLHCNYEENGKQKYIEFILVHGNQQQIYVIARDIIFKQQLKEQLQVNQQKSNMLNYVSHEFRTPLNCIINILSSILNKVKVNQEQMLQIALESSYHLLNLANDLLDLAQLKNNVFNIVITQFNITQLAEECLNQFQIQAAQQNVQLNIQSNIQNYIFVLSDRNRLKQILTNLIGNALKFTSDGNIDLILKQNQQILEIGVQDTGIGISPENVNKLFKAFSKVDNDKSNTLNPQGVGLGLLISNKIAKQLSSNGQGITVYSTEMQYQNHGSYFFFTLKLPETHKHVKLLSYKPQQKLNNHSSPYVGSEGPQKRHFTYTSIDQKLSQSVSQKYTGCFHILIVDDNVFNLYILEVLIKDCIKSYENGLNITLEKAHNGTSAVGKSCNKCNEECQACSLIFMDQEMPGLSGIDASKIILAKNPHVKIIIVSGNSPSETEKQSLLQIGIYDYIQKPIQAEKIKTILDLMIAP